MRSKLGLVTQEPEDTALVADLLNWMRSREADFTNTFRVLSDSARVAEMAKGDADFTAWHGRWQSRRERQPQSPEDGVRLMRAHNPAFIPRNHKVEEALEAATAAHDFSVMERLLDVLRRPYDDTRDLPDFSTPSPGGDRYRTFCGT